MDHSRIVHTPCQGRKFYQDRQEPEVIADRFLENGHPQAKVDSPVFRKRASSSES